MLCSRFLRPHRSEARTAACIDVTERACEWMHSPGMSASLARVMRHRRATMLASRRRCCVGTVVLFLVDAQGLHPERGHGADLALRPRPAQGISYDDMMAHQQQLNWIDGSKDPNIDGLHVGASGRRARRSANQRAHVHAPEAALGQRLVSRRPFMAGIAPQVGEVPGMVVYLQNPPPIRIGGRMSKGSTSSPCRRQNTRRSTGALPAVEAKMRDCSQTSST